MNENDRIEEEDQTSYLQNVPKGISFARLLYPPNNTEVIVCGVKRRAMLHSSFVTDLLVEMQPECTFVQLSPDHPMFIRPQGESNQDFKAEWHNFLKRGKDS